MSLETTSLTAAIRANSGMSAAFELAASVQVVVDTSADGLPVGAQLVAGSWNEAVLTRLASALEPLACWTQRRVTVS
jgi:Asp-tRNA(Asn)/Glu-tRNA(Gln) amidotransferase A subunit family amidase